MMINLGLLCIAMAVVLAGGAVIAGVGDWIERRMKA